MSEQNVMTTSLHNLRQGTDASVPVALAQAASRMVTIRMNAHGEAVMGRPCSAPGVGAPIPVAVAQAVAADAEVLVDVRPRGGHRAQRLLEQRQHLRICRGIVDHLPHDANVGALRMHITRSGTQVYLTGSVAGEDKTVKTCCVMPLLASAHVRVWAGNSGVSDKV